MKKTLALMLALIMVLVLVPTVALADAPVEVSTKEDLATALAGASSGTVVKVMADMSLNTVYTVKSGVTLTAATGVEITVSGSSIVFDMQTGATLDGLTILKTDKTAQAGIVNVRANCVVKNCSFTGQYVLGDAEVARAMLLTPHATGLLIEGNLVRALRQPAYIDGGVTGQIINNKVYGTRGWVVCTDATCTFTGNIFGGNTVDIAVIANAGAPDAHAYDDVAAISAANNGAYVENQVTGYSAANGLVFPRYSGKTTAVNSKVDPVYTITIPAVVNFGTLIKDNGIETREFDVAASGAVIEAGAHIDVAVQSSFTMSDGASPATTLAYSLYNTAVDGSVLLTGAQFASFLGNGVQDGRVTVNTGAITKAGSYSGTMVFTITYVD